jgi:hypothetical protein
MDSVELTAVFFREFQGIGLNESIGISRLRPVIDAYAVEAGTGVTHGATTGPTEKV